MLWDAVCVRSAEHLKGLWSYHDSDGGSTLVSRSRLIAPKSLATV